MVSAMGKEGTGAMKAAGAGAALVWKSRFTCRLKEPTWSGGGLQPHSHSHSHSQAVTHSQGQTYTVTVRQPGMAPEAKPTGLTYNEPEDLHWKLHSASYSLVALLGLERRAREAHFELELSDAGLVADLHQKGLELQGQGEPAGSRGEQGPHPRTGEGTREEPAACSSQPTHCSDSLLASSHL